MLEARGLQVCLGTQPVLHDVEVHVSRGQMVGIVGPNGSGKTTLLRALGGAVPRSGGSIRLNNRKLDHLTRRQIARILAVVSQQAVVSYPFLVRDVVMMGRTPHVSRWGRETTRDVAEAERCMKLTNTWELRDRPATELSGGELQRTMMARALAQEPQLLFLDEPTAHLDINHELEILTLLTELNRAQGLTVVLVTHNLNVAARYCEKLLLLRQGSVLDQAAPDRVLTAANVRRLFGVNSVVRRHPLTGSVYVVPLDPRRVSADRPGREHVHLVCGGGSGAALMRDLLEEGFEVSAGVLNVLDADQETAEALRITTVTEAPFSAITDEAHQENLSFIRRSQAVVVTTMPVGPGNLRNLEAALEAAERGIPVIVMQDEPGCRRDYTQGKAEAYRRALQRKGASVVARADEVVPALRGVLRIEGS